MSQRSFSELEFDTKKRKTRRELFLDKLEVLMPWQKLEAPIARYYAKAGSQGGRPPYPLSTMLRVHLMQLVYTSAIRPWKMLYTRLSRCVGLPVCAWTASLTRPQS